MIPKRPNECGLDMMLYPMILTVLLWCAMDPIHKNPSHVSVNIPAPLGSVMGNIIVVPDSSLECELSAFLRR